MTKERSPWLAAPNAVSDADTRVVAWEAWPLHTIIGEEYVEGKDRTHWEV
jgi:hypothetical protein